VLACTVNGVVGLVQREGKPVTVNPFDRCWDEFDAALASRKEARRIWNEYLSEPAHRPELVQIDERTVVLEVTRMRPIPVEFAAKMGDWLNHLRSVLDFTVWAAAACVAGTVPPPNQGRLSYPVAVTPKEWSDQKGRLAGLAPHQIDLIYSEQPLHRDVDAHAFRCIHDLARAARHRTHLTSTARFTERKPQVGCPAGNAPELHWGDRVLKNGHASVLRLTFPQPITLGEIRMNRRMEIEPEIEEWATSPFWGRIEFGERTSMLEVSVVCSVTELEYDCMRESRHEDVLSDEYRAEVDARPPFAPIATPEQPAPEWAPADPPTSIPPHKFLGSM
jgi:hypothetical protein